MKDKDLNDGPVAAESKIRVMSDDELTPAARAALHRRSNEELRRLAERANRRGWGRSGWPAAPRPTSKLSWHRIG